jgi:hypothetical protein
MCGPGAPVAFASNEGGRALALDLAQVFDVGVAMMGSEHIELGTRLEYLALPASVEVLLAAAIANLAGRRPSVTPAGPVAPQLQQATQHVVALWVLLEDLEDRDLRNHGRQRLEASFAQLFPQIARQIRDLLVVAHAVTTVEAAVGD